MAWPGQIGQIDSVSLSFESKLAPLVQCALRDHPASKANLLKQIHGSPLEDSSTDSRFDFLSAPRLNHDRVDALEVQEVRQQQASRACTQDSFLSSQNHLRPCIHACIRREKLRRILTAAKTCRDSGYQPAPF